MKGHYVGKGGDGHFILIVIFIILVVIVYGRYQEYKELAEQEQALVVLNDTKSK